MNTLLFVIPTWLIAVFFVLAALGWLADLIEDCRHPKSPEEQRREKEEQLRKQIKYRLDRDEWEWWDQHNKPGR